MIERLPSARGTPFHPALEPTDDLAIGNSEGGAPAQLFLIGNILDRAPTFVNL
jgi:hypothetical protein